MSSDCSSEVEGMRIAWTRQVAFVELRDELLAERQ